MKKLKRLCALLAQCALNEHEMQNFRAGHIMDTDTQNFGAIEEDALLGS
jgi:hypothetical protein